MANFRPAGLSDDDTDSDDYGFFEKLVLNFSELTRTGLFSL